MMGKLSTLDSADLVPMRRISGLSLFNFRKFEMNQDFISDKQRKGGVWILVCWIDRAGWH